jgi:endonuclease/exonuclease/phosphatase family metal-dependent hydrolase
MKRFYHVAAVILMFPAAFLAGIILYASLKDYNPGEQEFLFSDGLAVEPLSLNDTCTIATWNIGYAGLDRGMDFFYDGGRNVRTGEGQLTQNFSGISQFLFRQDSADMILLQEVDHNSRRSYHTGQNDALCRMFSEFECFYAKNYDVFFVPLPLRNPMGGVNSGLLSLTRYRPAEVDRFAYPGSYAWPKKLFMLDRCFMVMRYPLSDGSEFLVVNTHNEAYDSGRIRDRQMAYLHQFLLSEYGKGNYVLVGGDWNQCPPGFQPDFSGQVFDTINLKRIGHDFLPGDWSWVFDNSVPSNRRIDIPYDKGLTRTTVIDFFLLSPNLTSLGCRTVDLDFAYSDHHPVVIKVTFSPSVHHQ